MSTSAALPQGHGHEPDEQHPHDGHGHDDHGHGHGHEPQRDDHGHEHDHGHGHGHGGLRGALRDLVRPHSHDAADAVDAAMESTSEGIRAVKIGLVGLGLTGALQVVVALVSSSVALLADTIHNLADALTSLPLWVAFVLARRPASRRYTYGLGRAEDIAGIAIIGVIAASAVVAGWESVRRLSDPQPVDHLGWVIAAGLVGFAGNELVASYRIRVGRTIGSAALVADGLHARTDGMTSLAVVVGALGVAAGWRRADPVVGVVITVAILVVLRGAAVQVYRRLMDAVDPELVDAAEASLRATPGVLDVVELRLRWIGHRIRAEVGVVVDASATLVQAHDIAEDARHRLLHDVPRLDDATVHVDPSEVEGMDHHAPTAHHRRPG